MESLINLKLIVLTAEIICLLFFLLVSVSQSDSIMYYTDGTNWATYNDNNFIPVFTDDVESWVWKSDELKTQALQTCGEDMGCLYDVFVTGELAIGASSKATAVASAETTSALRKTSLSPAYSLQLYLIIRSVTFCKETHTF